MTIHEVSCQLGGRELKIETGRLAKQSNGSVLVSYGDTRVLVTACSATEARKDIDFFPLTVEYAEKFYSAGRIPGSFFRREGRPTSEATLSARMIDRPIRPLFPETYRNETQIVATILSYDPECDPDSVASIGASAALHISDIPFNGPTAGVRIGRMKDGDYIINPTWEQTQDENCDIEVFLTGTKNAIMMVEGGAKEVPEQEVLDALLAGHTAIKEVVSIIEDLREKCGKEKRPVPEAEASTDFETQVLEILRPGIGKALSTKDKLERYQLVDAAVASAKEKFISEEMKANSPDEASERAKKIKQVAGDLKYDLMREAILDKKTRIDGRDLTTVRPIATETSVLPRPHGSALFTRGETQVLSVITLGTGDDEQIVDSLQERTMRQQMLHYNFPPFSVGECGRMGGQSRREIGHGKLAERGIAPLLPTHEAFPYTIRIVCETLESNGSSSMGSVCSGSMALMDAGVPIARPVAGIAMGLIKEGEKFAVLTDILGDEDHLGDMDFKVAGTDQGVTAIQMDIKIEGVNEEIMKTALAQAHEGRLHILGEMSKTIQKSREDLAETAPRITTVTVPVEKIGELIGPSGKNIKAIIAETECKIDISDDGKVHIASSNGDAVKKAIHLIESAVAEVEVDKTYKGVVKKVVEFGAFVGVLPNKDGLLHISEIAHERVNDVTDVLNEGDEVEVKVIEIDRTGKIRLSRKALLPMPEGFTPPPPRSDRGGGRGGDRGGRSGGGGGRGGPRGGGDRGGRGGGYARH